MRFVGTDITLIAIGGVVHNALRAAEELRTEHISANVLDMHTLKPLDVRAIENAAYDTKYILTIEEHSIIGGLGSAVAEVIAGSNSGFRRLGLDDCFACEVGDQEYLREKHGLSVEAIVSAAKELMEK